MRKTPWNKLREIFDELSDFERTFSLHLANARGEKITIPVSLYLREEKLLSARVSMLPTSRPLEGAAVYLLDTAIRRNHLYLAWDKAIAGTGNKEIDGGTYLAHDDIAHNMLGYDPSLNLRDNLLQIKKGYNYRIDNGGIPLSEYEQLMDVCTTVIADSAEVRSADIERMLHDFKPWYCRLGGFRARGLEI